MYITVAVIINGALEEEHIVYSYNELNDLVTDEATKAATDGLRTQIYVLVHDHPFSGDDVCACSQYITDHNPYVTFNEEVLPA